MFYAIKCVRKLSGSISIQKDQFDSVMNEAKVCSELNHPFLVKLMHSFETPNLYCMVFECTALLLRLPGRITLLLAQTIQNYARRYG